MKAVFHFPGIAIVLFVVSNRRIKENDNLSLLLSYSAFPPKNTFPGIKPLHRHFYLFSWQRLKKNEARVYSFHNGERIKIKLADIYHSKGKAIKVPKKKVSYRGRT